MLDTVIIITCAIGALGCLLYLRFAPSYVSDRSRRYVRPRKDRAGKRL